MARGATAYLTKPLDVIEFEQVMSSVLDSGAVGES
jgi:hypothetical protein